MPETYQRRLVPLGRHARVGREQGGAEYQSFPLSHGTGALVPGDVQAAGKKHRAVNEMSLDGETDRGLRPPFFLPW